jgi:hypothetical protein
VDFGFDACVKDLRFDACVKDLRFVHVGRIYGLIHCE